jgi:hypothetical protein
VKAPQASGRVKVIFPTTRQRALLVGSIMIPVRAVKHAVSSGHHEEFKVVVVVCTGVTLRPECPIWIYPPVRHAEQVGWVGYAGGDIGTKPGVAVP